MKEISINRAGVFGLRVIQGIIVGVGGVLPGVSGGVLCMAFGLYKPIMEVIASPKKNLKKNFSLLLPLVIGMAVGFLLLVNLVGKVMESNSALATCAFAGLILGTLPSLFRAAGEQERTKGSFIALAVSFILCFSVFMYLKMGVGFSIEPNFFWYCFAGIIWGVSIVLPGLSSASILLFLGLFNPMLQGARSFDLSVIVPLAIGGGLSLILLSRLINSLFEKHFSVISHIIIGVVLATTVPLLSMRFSGFADFAVKAAMVIIGFAVAMIFDGVGKKVK